LQGLTGDCRIVVQRRNAFDMGFVEAFEGDNGFGGGMGESSLKQHGRSLYNTFGCGENQLEHSSFQTAALAEGVFDQFDDHLYLRVVPGMGVDRHPPDVHRLCRPGKASARGRSGSWCGSGPMRHCKDHLQHQLRIAVAPLVSADPPASMAASFLHGRPAAIAPEKIGQVIRFPAWKRPAVALGNVRQVISCTRRRGSVVAKPAPVTAIGLPSHTTWR
jgi:hypothetical protein